MVVCSHTACVLFVFMCVCAGQERFRALTSTFYRGAVGIIFGEQSTRPATETPPPRMVPARLSHGHAL
jgi:hypothetical protein